MFFRRLIWPVLACCIGVLQPVTSPLFLGNYTPEHHTAVLDVDTKLYYRRSCVLRYVKVIEEESMSRIRRTGKRIVSFVPLSSKEDRSYVVFESPSIRDEFVFKLESRIYISLRALIYYKLKK